MKLVKYCLITPIFISLFLLNSISFAADRKACPRGQASLHDDEPCIPQELFEYLYCLGKSGGGKVEIIKRDDTSNTTGLEVSIGGKGSGVVIKGEGNGNFKSTETKRTLNELSEKLSPALVSNCKSIASPAKNKKVDQSALDPMPARSEYEKKFFAVNTQLGSLDSSFFNPQLAFDSQQPNPPLDALAVLQSKLQLLTKVFEGPTTQPGARLLTRTEWDGLRALLDELGVLVSEIDRTKALFLVNIEDLSTSKSKSRALNWTTEEISKADALLSKTQGLSPLRTALLNKRS